MMAVRGLQSVVERGSRRRALTAVALLAAGLVAGPGAADDDLTAARAALSDGLYAVAESNLNRVLARPAVKPRDAADALQLLCRAHAEQGRPGQVLADLDSHAATVAAAPDRGAFLFWRAAALLDAGRPVEALAAARGSEASRATGARAAVLNRLAARACAALGQMPEALALFDRVDRSLTEADARAENLLDWARVLADAGRPEEALDCLVRQSACGATNAAAADGQVLAARLLGHAGREAEAEAGLRRVLSLPWADADRRSDAWLELADLALAAGRTNDAVAAVDAAVRQARNRAAAWRCGLRGGGVLLRDPATLDTGAAMLKTAIRADPGRPEAARAQLALADACAAAGRFDRADDEYRIYLEAFADPAGTTTALRGRAWALLRRGRPGEAASVFQKAAESTTNPAARAECLFKAADALHADGRFAQAAHGYEAVADAADDPALAARARLMAADATDRGGDSAAAERLYLDVAARHAAAPEASEALLRVAMLRERRNAIDEAIDAYTRAMDATTNAGQRGRALIGRGRAQSRAYRFEAARADFARAETESPAAADEAAYLSALALYGLGRDDEADRACRAFLERYRTSPLRADATLWLARHQYNQGVYEDAQRLFLAYVAEWPGGGWADAALLWAGRAAFRRTAYAEAVEQLARLAREYPSSPRLAEGRFVQADALGELARFEEAILLLDEIVTRFPESEWAAQAWGRKGDCLFSLGAESPARYEEALKAYAMVTARPDVSAELALQAEFKAGRCLEKLQRTDAAIDQYYTRVVVRFLRERSEGVWHNEAAQTWFAKAAFQLADMLEARDDIEQAMRVLQRVVQADVAGREEARARIQRLQTESRWPL